MTESKGTVYRLQRGPTAAPETDRTVYALLLEDDYIYVGQTTRAFAVRLREHVEGKGALWAQLHPVREVLVTAEVASGRLERLWTLDYMREYGLEKVRGGRWCGEHLTRKQLRQINTALKQRQTGRRGGRCAYCLHGDHSGKDCPLRPFPYVRGARI